MEKRTIIDVWIETDSGHKQPIHMDHRTFEHMIQDVDDIIGRKIEYKDEQIFFENAKE